MSNIAITQFWDYRLLYIYALFGGYIDATEQEISEAVINFVNENENFDKCEAFLGVLEKNELIYPKGLDIQMSVRNIENLDTGEVTVSENPQPQMNTDGIIEVRDEQWFRDKVRAYLKTFRNDLIFHPYTDNQVSYYKQRSEVLDSLEETKQRQTVDGSQQSGKANPMQFLETIFSMVDEDIVSIYHIEPVLYSSPAGVQRFGMDTTMFEAIIALEVPKASISRKPQLKNMPTTAMVKIDGTQIFIGIQGEDLVPLWRVRTDSGPYNFMHYIQAHTNQNVGIGDINTLDGCASYRDMTEVVRNLHFDKYLKKLFFDGTTKKVVRFTSTKELGGLEVSNFKSLLRNYASKS